MIFRGADRTVRRRGVVSAIRIRIGGMVEWALAAGIVLALVAAGSFLAREYRSVAGVIPVNVRASSATAPLIAPPAVVPSGAVSLPMLVLSDGRDVRVGETVTEIAARIPRSAEVAAPAVERAPNGERVTRTYTIDAVRFWLVFEPFEKNVEPRLAAIYR